MGDLAGKLEMFDMSKLIKLSEYQFSKSIVKTKYWAEQKMFVSGTAGGEVVVNGFGQKNNHLSFKVSKKAVNDFAMAGEFDLIVCSDEGKVQQIDIRKF